MGANTGFQRTWTLGAYRVKDQGTDDQRRRTDVEADSTTGRWGPQQGTLHSYWQPPTEAGDQPQTQGGQIAPGKVGNTRMNPERAAMLAQEEESSP